MILRTIHCDICGAHYGETDAGEGFPDWGQLSGVSLDGDPNPTLCPVCLSRAAAFIDELKEEHRNGVDQ